MALFFIKVSRNVVISLRRRSEDVITSVNRRWVAVQGLHCCCILSIIRPCQCVREPIQANGRRFANDKNGVAMCFYNAVYYVHIITLTSYDN